MLTKFWEKVGEQLGSRWASALYHPGWLFTLLGLCAWSSRQPKGWQAIVETVEAMSTGEKVFALVVFLGVMLISGELLRWTQGWLLRFLEGYWPVVALRERAVARKRARLQKKRDRWQELGKTVRDRERWEVARLDYEVVILHPPQDAAIMPTALGNRIRAAEEYSEVRYGLNAVDVFPRLWSLLPEAVRSDLAESRESLNAAVCLLAWGVLSLIWCLWAWWTILPASLMIVIAWLRALDAAEVYGELLRAAFDLHRFDLYKALHWPLPVDTESERAHGERLTVYLFRGQIKGSVAFAHEKASKETAD